MRNIAIAVLIGIATAMVFVAAVGFGLVNLDDYIYIESHPEVKGGLSLAGVKWAFTWIGDAMWTPLTWVSYMADQSIGWGTAGMHGIGVVLQGVNAALIFLFLVSLFGSGKGTVLAATIASLLWAVHPLRVESVVWIASRKDMISTFFFLLALIAWTKGRSLGLLTAILLVVVGGLAKSSVMLFPAFAIGIDLILARRKPWWAYGVIVLLSLGFAVESGWAQQHGGAMDPGIIPRWFGVVNAAASLTIYAGNVLCPNDLAVECILRYPSMPRWSPIGLLAIIAFAWWGYGLARRIWEARGIAKCRDEVACFGGVLLFFAGLVPFLGLVPFGLHAFADRFTILPSIGLSLAAVAGWRWFVASGAGRGARAVLLSGGAVAVVALGLVAVRQTAFWRDDVTLFSRTVAVDGECNLVAKHILALHAWEFEHDMEKVYTHLSALFKSAPWIAEQYGSMVPLFIEAAYETGHVAEADDAFIWICKWDGRQIEQARREGNLLLETTMPYLFADAIRLAYKDGLLDEAEKKLAKIRELKPNNFMTLDIAHLIARRSGDAKRIAETRAACTNAVGEVYCLNRWARKND